MAIQSPATCGPASTQSKPRVALLVDGENLTQDLAGKIIQAALAEGEVVIRRVYGDAGRLPKWNAAPGFKMMHSGSGKNATDLLLTVEAMALMLGRQADVLCIAASDGDYTHLATYLREAGFRVVGLGESKASERLRKSFTRFRELAVSDVAKVASPTPPKPDSAAKSVLDKVIALIRDEGGNDGFTIVKLSGRMHALHQTKISTLPEKTWRNFLTSHEQIFECEPKGQDSKVRLRNAAR
jgi:NYN domain